VLFIGDDWAEAHHDIEIEDEAGRVLARRRLPEGLAGITMLHELVAEHLDPAAEPDQVLIGIETERGPWVQALLAAGYVVFAINPLQVARYRERHSPSGRSRMPRMRICWPRSSGWTGPITARSRGILRSLSM
jgi:transposase